MKKPIDIHIGQRLRQRRWQQGMTQGQLGQAIGIRFQQVQKYESGANRVSASRLWEISLALRENVSFFFGGLDGPTSSQADGLGDGVLGQRETIELVRAYYAMAEEPRRRLLALADAIGNRESPAISEIDLGAQAF